jgi:GMP synthase (glutamine-hydrolysing)
MKNILIIDCGETLDPVKSEFGHCVDWISDIAEDTCECKISVNEVYKGEKLTESQIDGVIITGSAESVYDELPWMLYLERKILEYDFKHIPILGICFGHQLIVKTFGGLVEKNSKGWEIGSSKIHLTEKGRKSDLFRDIPEKFIVYESHQDTATFIPANMSVLAENFFGNQAVVCNNTTYGIQFHPEFSRDISQAYLNGRMTLDPKIAYKNVKSSLYGHEVLKNYIKLL